MGNPADGRASAEIGEEDPVGEGLRRALARPMPPGGPPAVMRQVAEDVAEHKEGMRRGEN